MSSIYSWSSSSSCGSTTAGRGSTTPVPSTHSTTPKASATAGPAVPRIAPLVHPRSKMRYVALTRAHVAQVTELDEQAAKLLAGLCDVHGAARGPLRATAAWLMLEMLEAHFEATNALSAQRYGTICAWEPENAAVGHWAAVMAARYALQMRESPAAPRES